MKGYKMDNLSLPAFKLKQLGRWCKIGAWSALGFGIFSMLFDAIYAWHYYIQLQAQIQALNINNTPSSQNYLFTPNSFSVLPYLAEMCQNAVLPIAIFIALAIAGTIFTTLATAAAPTSQETEDIVYEPLKIPVKMHE
jgi:hypothetical protein